MGILPGLLCMARLLLLAIAGLAGCAAPMPLLGGGATTPEGRVDVVAGGAARVPFGELREVPEAMGRDASRPGVAPVGAVRVGLDDFDVGAMISGATARLDLRLRYGLTDRHEPLATAFLFDFAAFGGPTGDPADRGASGTRWGFDVPIMFTLDASSVAELWVGPRFGFEHVEGDLGASREGANPAPLSLSFFRSGAVLGLALGFRRVHALMELTASYEWASGEVDGADVSRSGLVLTPAFALRVRF